MAEKHSAKLQLMQAKNTRLKAAQDAKHAAATAQRALQRQLEEITATQESALKAKDTAGDQQKKAVAEVKKLRARLREASEELQSAHRAQARQREEITKLQEGLQRLCAAVEAAKAEAQGELKKAHEAEMKLQETEQMMEDLKCQLSEAQAAQDLLRQLDEDAKVALEEMAHRPNFSIPNTSFAVEDRPHQDTRHQQEEIGKQQSSPHISRSTPEDAVSSGRDPCSDIFQTTQELHHLVEEMEVYLNQGWEKKNADEANKDAMTQAQQQIIEGLQKELKELRELHSSCPTLSTARETSAIIEGLQKELKELRELHGSCPTLSTARETTANSSGATSLSFSLSRDAREIREMVEQMGSQLSQQLTAEASQSVNEEDKQTLLKAQQQIQTLRQRLVGFLAQQAQASISMQQYYQSCINRLRSEKDVLYARETQKQNNLRNQYLKQISWRDQRMETLQSSLNASQCQTSTYFQLYISMKAQYDIKVDQLLRSRASEKYLNARLASRGESAPLLPPPSQHHRLAVVKPNTKIVPKDVPTSSHGVDNACVAQQCAERAEEAAAAKAVICKRLSLKVYSLRVRNARTLRQHILQRDALKRKQRAIMKQLKTLKTSKAELVRATRLDIDNLQTALAEAKVTLQDAAGQNDWLSQQLSEAVTTVDKQKGVIVKLTQLCNQRKRRIEDLQKDIAALKAQPGAPQIPQSPSIAADSLPILAENFDDSLLSKVKRELCDAFIVPSSTTTSSLAQSAQRPVTEVVHRDVNDGEGTGVGVPSQAKPPSKLGKRPRETAPQEFNKRR